IAMEDGHIEGCLFFQPLPGVVPLSTGSPDPKMARLQQAEAALITEDVHWTTAVETIESSLRSESVPSHYPATAVRACLAQGQAPRAEAILNTALKLAPEDAELQFLGRILQREHPEHIKK